MSDLLKQAIADAKAVRATALSNAKAALEEHFAPKLQSMLSEKLAAEMAEEEVAAPEAAPAPEAHADAAQDAAMMAAQSPEAAPAPEAAPTAEVPVEEPAPALEGADEEEIEEYQTLGSGNPDPVEKSLALEAKKASSNYKAKTKGHKTENHGQEVVDATKLTTSGEPKAVADSTKASSDYTKVTAGHKTQDPQGASNEVVKLEESDEITEESLDEILKELENSVNDVGGAEEMAAPMEAAAHDAEEIDEVIDLDELLSEEKEEGEKEEDEGEKEEANEAIVKENLSLKKEIEEYRSGIEFLRSQINEINLLNAKLLYTNKLFKVANLTNEQKLRVIESFDLTKSVREAKLVYATLAESINSGAKKVETPIKKSSTVKNITEGLASKPVASTKPKTAAVLTEGADMANRFKKLAGIRSK
jgi:hypothetical protein